MSCRILIDRFADREITDWAESQPGTPADRELLAAEILAAIFADFSDRPDRLLPGSLPVPGRPLPTFRCEIYPGVWLWYTVERTRRWWSRRPDVVTVIRFS